MTHVARKIDAVSPLLIYSKKLVPGLLGLLLVALVTSCGDGDHDKSSSSTAGSITIKEEHDWSDDHNTYDWNSPGPVARVNLEIDDFHHGDLLVNIFDSQGRTIFSKLYWSFDWYWYINGEYSDVDFTKSGAAGLWTIELSFSEFTGDVKLVVESTEDLPPDPVVPPPNSNSPLLDSTFGDNGRAPYAPDTSAGRRFAVDSVGRIVVCGTLIDSIGSRRLSVWRFLST